MASNDIVLTGRVVPIDLVYRDRKLPPGPVPLGWYRCEFAAHVAFPDYAMARLDLWISRNLSERWASFHTTCNQGTRVVLYFEDESDLVSFSMMDGREEFKAPEV